MKKVKQTPSPVFFCLKNPKPLWTFCKLIFTKQILSFPANYTCMWVWHLHCIHHPRYNNVTKFISLLSPLSNELVRSLSNVIHPAIVFLVSLLNVLWKGRPSPILPHLHSLPIFFILVSRGSHQQQNHKASLGWLNAFSSCYIPSSGQATLLSRFPLVLCLLPLWHYSILSRKDH